MAGSPNDILRALADPERPAIAGLLARAPHSRGACAPSHRQRARGGPRPHVNDIVGRFFNDHASLRRYLVDEGRLSRERGRYWRTGGRVEF